MKKYILSIIGMVIELAGITLMIFGFINNRSLIWVGLPIVFVGFALILAGIFKNAAKSS